MTNYKKLLIGTVFLIIAPHIAFASHPVVKCVQKNDDGYIAYFGFEGRDSHLPIGIKNRFFGALNCATWGQDCGQGTKFVNNGPYESDRFGSDSLAKGQDRLAVAFSSSVTWLLSNSSVTATVDSTPCITPTLSPNPTAISTATSTPTATATFTPLPTVTSTTVPTAVPHNTSTPIPLPTFFATIAPLQPSPVPSNTASPTKTSDPTPSATPTRSAEGASDCKGILGGTAKLDCCSVCGGDGTTCPELWSTIDNRPLKKVITRRVRRSVSSIRRNISQEIKCNRRSKTAVQRRAETSELKAKIGKLLDVYLDTMRVCNSSFCQKTSYQEVNLEIRTAVRRLTSLDKISQRFRTKVCCVKLRQCGVQVKKKSKRKDTITKVLDALPPERCD